MSMCTVYDLDVWGNAEDGWQVNSWKAIGKFDDNGKDDIINYLYVNEFITSNNIDDFIVDEINEDVITILSSSDGMPLFDVVKNDTDGYNDMMWR